MKLSLLLAALALFEGTSAQYHTDACYTKQLRTKPKTKPHTYYSNITKTGCTRRTTLDRTQTITPQPYTEIVSSTVVVTVTGAATTDTATTTTTETTTTTGTVTNIDTVSSTTTLASSVVTVSAAATFQPVSDTLPGTSNQPTTPNKRHRRGNQLSSNKKYPGDVQCYKYYTKCTTSTVTHTCTRTAARSTVTTTTTSTITTTPGVSTTSTVTVSTTALATITATVTSISVATAYGTTVSSYAACATPNIAYYYNNQLMNGISPDYSVVSMNFVDASSDYDCCTKALLNPVGAFWTWGYNVCSVFTSDSTCEASRASRVTLRDSGNPGGMALGNANCGQFTP